MATDAAGLFWRLKMSIHDMKNDYYDTTSYMNYIPGQEQLFGDIISPEKVRSRRKVRVGLVSTGYFEFWRQYDNLLGHVIEDAELVRSEIASRHQVTYTGLVDTIDKAVEAGRILREAQVDVLILAYRTYIPDVYIYHLLTGLEHVPILFLTTQNRKTLSWDFNYSDIYRTSGMMAQIQLVAGLRKMGVAGNKMHVIAGYLGDPEVYRRIDDYLNIVELSIRLKHMTIGVIGNVFRGMCDFEFDKTKVKGNLGPEVINISIELLQEEYDSLAPDHPEVTAMFRDVRENYLIEGCAAQDLEWAVRLAVAMRHIVQRFSLDGIALLGQHFIEKLFKTEPYLAINELQRQDICLGTTEGDVLGLIAMIILKQITGNTPFQLEYSEFDLDRNALMLLGHGHADPREARKNNAVLGPACEHWGHEGTGVCGCFVPKPGTCTLAHFIEDAQGWKMFVHPGEILDLEPLKINETHAVVRIREPILDFTEKLVKAGVPHHAITVRGNAVHEMRILADLLNIQVLEI
jgi:L-arabinose isomerase